MATAADIKMTAGQWLPTGWGAQHRVRSFTDTHVVLACHGAGPDQRAELVRVRVDVEGEPYCTSCERAGGPGGLGPSPRGVVGEVRRTPEGLIAVCVADLAGVGKWRFVGTEPAHSHGRCEDWYMGNAERIAVIPGTPASEHFAAPHAA